MTLDLDGAVLLPVDMQRAFDRAPWPRRWNGLVDQNGLSILARWREKGLPIVHVRHDSVIEGSTLAPGSEGNQLRPGFEPADGEPLVSKSVNSAFIGTDLDRHLRDTGQSRLVILGIITNNSLEATVRNAANLGYAVLVPEDCCFTFAKRDLNGRLWPAEDVHALSLANLHGEYATICTSAAIRAALPR